MVVHARSYQVDIDSRPSSLGPPFTGHFRVLLDTPRGLQPLHPGSKPQARDLSTLAAKTEEGSATSRELRTNVYQTQRDSNKENLLLDSTAQKEAAKRASEAENEQTEPARHNCDVCGVDCTRSRYHSTKGLGGEEYEICPNCYLEARFPSSCHSGDFVRVDALAFKHGREDGWTDAETLLLLEALEMYDDGDWDKIAEHVGTRSREQCVTHFLQMPIEDPFLEQTQEDLGPLRYGSKMPFTQSDNPIMSVVAFLASAVDPKVAAAAAHSAVDELKSGLRNGAKVEQEEAMQVDGEAGERSTNGMARAASVAIGSAAAKASTLAASEDRELTRLVRETVQAQVRKLDLKLKHFDELEAALDLERRGVEALRQQLIDERLIFAQSYSASSRPLSLTHADKLVAEIQKFQAGPSSVQLQDIAHLGATGVNSGYPPHLIAANSAGGLSNPSYASM